MWLEEEEYDMHYVNCILCDAYYSADGNPYTVTDEGDKLCENCTDQIVEVEKDHIDGNTVYTITNEYVLEIHEMVCDDFEDLLKKNEVKYTRKSSSDVYHDTFTIPDIELTILSLKGINIDHLI